MQMLTVIFVLSISSAFGANFKLTFDSSDLEFDDTVVKMDLVMKKKDGKSVINFNADLLEEIKDNIHVHLEIYEKEKGHYHSITNNSISLCRALDKTTSIPLVKILLAEILKYSNFPTACPMKKNKYYLKDFVLNEDLVPPFVLPPEGDYKTKIQLDRDVDGGHKMMAKVTIFTKIEHKGFF
ncbi:unnamed protein product [Diamesa tonsa]